MSQLKISIYSHDDSFVDLLFDSEKEFEGQLTSPIINEKSTGTKTFNFSLPLKIFDKKKNKILDNPRWSYLVNQYKIRVEENGNIEEFVMIEFSENHNDSDQIIMDITCQSLAEFELSRIGYNIKFDENNLFIFEEGTNPNEEGNYPIGLHDADIHFWNQELLKNTDWSYSVQSYYDVDTELENDNRQEKPSENKPFIGTNQFYEDSRIIDYDDNNNPIKDNKYTIKERIIKAEKSNIFNITQDIAESFEVWVGYKITYLNNRVEKKEIMYRNDVAEDSLFSINYTKNLKNITRNVDNNSIVTKMYVTPMENSNTDEGQVSIATCGENFTKENYLLDFSWYLGEDRKEDIDINNSTLLNNDLGMTFNHTAYTPNFNSIVTKNTKETISEYEKNMRSRNIYLRKLSLQLSQAKEDLINLKNSYELFLSARNAAQENVDKLVDGTESLPKGSQAKNNKVFYLYPHDKGLQITFSEKGIKELPRASTFNSPINLLDLQGHKYSDSPKPNERNVKDIKLEVLTRDDILQTITSALVKNVQLGKEEKYGCFKADLIYNPLEYNQKLIDYWQTLATTNNEQVQILGLSKAQGGTETAAEGQFNGVKNGISSIKFNEDKIFNHFAVRDLIKIAIEGQEKLYTIVAVDKNTNEIGIQSSDFENIIVGTILPIKIIGRIYGRELFIQELQNSIFQAQLEKDKVIKEFEKLLYPFVREGYWEDSSYTTYMNKIEEKNEIGPQEKINHNKVNPEDWSDDYWSYLIPNPLLGYLPRNGESKPVYLYDVIDIRNIEVMSNNIVQNKYDENFKIYVPASTNNKGDATNYTVDYGYTSVTKTEKENRGIYINFYEPYKVHEFTQDATTQMYVRIKARGSGNYVWEGYIKNQHYTNSDGIQKRMFFAPLVQEIVLEDKDIILDSLKIKFNTGKINYINTDQRELKFDSYDLVYGTDYYSYKETKDNKTFTKIRLSPSTNVPLGSFDIPNTYIYYTVNGNYDTTSKYYYNDAKKTLRESSIPQVSYAINVVDLSALDLPFRDYKTFKPSVGKRVLIYDSELRLNGIVGFISEINRDLFEPQNNNIVISDYKDKFEDLFQKITAATIQLQSNYDYFQKATETTDKAGNIDTNLLEQSLLENNLSLSLNKNNDVVWDENGITITDKQAGENGVFGKVRITSGGIFMTDKYDQYGNYRWESAITPNGINASKITVGHIDTRQIQLWNSSQPRFVWNENGIYAYGLNNNKTDYNTYVLFNQDGLIFKTLNKITESIDLINLVQNANFNSTNFWNSIVAGAGNPTLDIISGANYNILKSTSKNETSKILIKQTTANFDPTHKYYYRVKINCAGIPKGTPIKLNIGFTNILEHYNFIPNDEGNVYSGFVTSLTPQDFFMAELELLDKEKDWSVSITEPMIIDINEACGESTDVNLDFLNDIPFFIEGTTYSNSYDAYSNALSLDWNGLKIGAQKDALTLSSENGLEVFQPASIAQGGKQLRVQVGMWEEETASLGKEIILKKKYGIRGLNANGVKIFELSQDGFSVRYEDEETPIENLINNNIAYNVLITSSNGSSFTNGNIKTMLTATVYKGQKDVTQELKKENFIWSRTSANEVADKEWNYKHKNVGNQVNITNLDFDDKAVFNCSIEIKEV